MYLLTMLLALVFAVLVGRNDGALLVALAVRTSHRRSWWAPTALITATVLVPALGDHGVAQTLAGIFTASARSSGIGLAVVLFATISTLLFSAATRIPTSITLALVGASAGAQIAHGVLDSDRILRVLLLAAAGPVVAWLLALAVTRVLTLTRGSSLERTIRWQQITSFVATAVAYGANDGQKLLAVFAVMFGVSVTGGSIDPRIIALVAVCFGIGTMLGLRRSAASLRQGVLHPKPYQVASTLWSSAAAVLIGSALAAPMSMTQSITGALIGSAPFRQWRRVRWEQSRRVVLAWVCTLPIAAIAGWGLTLAVSSIRI